MQLLKVDHLKSTTGITGQPTITFRMTGTIGITPELFRKVCPEALESNDTYYLHIYTDENPKANPEIGIVIDKEAQEGLLIRFDKSDKVGGRSKTYPRISAKPVISKMTKDFDWALGPEKLPVIKYTLDDQSQLSDGTKIYILR